MKTTDLAALTGKIKGALQAWANGKVDKILPGDKAMARSFLKNFVNNVLVRFDESINKHIDTFFLFVADVHGEIDSDVVVDHLAGMFNEMEVIETDFAGFHIKAGKGRAEVLFPRNFMTKLIAGNIGGFALNADDIRELKQFINN